MEELPNIEVTQNWSKNIILSGLVGYTSDEDLPDPIAAQVYTSCKAGVKDAHIFVMLAPTTPTRGAWFEAGLADGTCHMVSVGDPGSAFRTAFHRVFKTEDEVIDWLSTISNWNVRLNAL